MIGRLEDYPYNTGVIWAIYQSAGTFPVDINDCYDERKGDEVTEMISWAAR